MRAWMLGMTLLSTSSWACSPESLKLTDGDFSVTVSHFKASSRKHIMIIPPTGGINLIDKSYGRKFCQAGFNAYIPVNWSQDDEYNLELSIHTRFYARAQRAIELMVKQIPDGEEIGILGTSVGGLHTAIAVGRLPQIKQAFVIVGGADIADMIVHSDQEAMKVAKEKRMKMFLFKDKEHYLEELRSHILLEPLKLTGHKGKKLGMVLSTQDVVVPTKNQLLLKELWQPQKVMLSKRNHFWAIVNTWLFDQSEIIEFFK